MPLVEAIRAHVFAAERIHADDTTVPVLAAARRGPGGYGPTCATTGRSPAPTRRRRPSSTRPTAAARIPRRIWPAYAGLMQADAYAGFNRLYEAGRKPGPIVEAACWAHARRKFFELARLNKAPIALEAVTRIDALFAIEREINGQPPTRAPRASARSAAGRWSTSSRPGCASSTPGSRRKPSSPRRSPTASTAGTALTRFLDDGRLCMTNNAAERALRGIAVGRHNWTFAGSDAGGRRAAAIYTLIETAKLNDVDPQAWLADVLARLQDHPAKRIDELLPWNWKRLPQRPPRRSPFRPGSQSTTISAALAVRVRCHQGAEVTPR